MGQLTGAVLGDLDVFWTGVFQQSNLPLTPPGARWFSEVIPTGCGYGEPGKGPFYCFRDRTIYMDFVFLSGVWTNQPVNGLAGDSAGAMLGNAASPPRDATFAVILAHEYAHHIQNLIGVRPGQVYPPAGFELQADCWAGAFLRWADDRGKLDPGDRFGAIGTAARYADPDGSNQLRPSAHGTAVDRMEATNGGFQGTVNCASYTVR